MEKLSIVDIAKMAKVSIATVSRVLNQNGRYSIETERRILALVEEHGYTPNANAKSLRTNRSQTIGVIVPDITNEFFAKIVRSLENEILPYGYSVFICDSHENAQIENTQIANLVAKNVDGVVYLSGQSDVAGLEASRNIPAVYIDRRPENAPVTIQSDNSHGGFLATSELLEKGCRRILFLPDFNRLSTMIQRLDGYTKAHEAYGLTPDPMLNLPDAVNYEGAKQAIAQICDEGKLMFDGIFATNDRLALGALHALHERGVGVPEQVRLVGFDDISISAFCDVPLTTITQDTGEIGRICVDLLLRMMNGEKVEQQHIIVPVALHIRRST